MKTEHHILLTAFFEGMAVLVIELAGARALAPYYGASLKVWTAQITATLLFLALGYGLGGLLSRKTRPLALPGVFWAAGAWLALFPFWRNPALAALSNLPGVGLGSFIAGSFLFGPPLLALGAVSPLLIQRLQKDAAGGPAAGGVFFTNTLGGLAGGWLTALVLVPHCPLRVIIAGTGAALGAAGSLWGWNLARGSAAAASALLCLLFISTRAPGLPRLVELEHRQFTVLHSQASSSGLIQVVREGERSSLMLDGMTQGGMDEKSGLTAYEFTEYQAYLGWRFHPKAEKALLLGLGTGLLAKQLYNRGMEVEAVEIEPGIESAARVFFGLPARVRVHNSDARAFLNKDGPGYDLIFLDVFAGESIPWHLVTLEAFARMKARLNPGGRLIVNTITRPGGNTAGMALMESALSRVFAATLVFCDGNEDGNPRPVNAILVAGSELAMNGGKGYPGKALELIAENCRRLAAAWRPARPGDAPPTDELGNLDHADAELRAELRRDIMEQLGAELLDS